MNCVILKKIQGNGMVLMGIMTAPALSIPTIITQFKIVTAAIERVADFKFSIVSGGENNS